MGQTGAMNRALLALPLAALILGAAPPPLPPMADAPSKPVFLPTPAPPPPPAPGSPWYAEQRASEERRLREECYSAAAIRLIIDHNERMRTVTPEARAAGDAVQREVAEAAYTTPLDLDRLERAVAARDRLQAEGDARRRAQGLALLRSLPAADQAIYAREFSLLRPAAPQRSCSG